MPVNPISIFEEYCNSILVELNSNVPIKYNFKISKNEIEIVRNNYFEKLIFQYLSNSNGLMLNFSDTILNPKYDELNDTITMIPIQYFETSIEYYASLFHELAHSTRHVDRMDRNLFRFEEEIVSEMVSVLFLLSDEQRPLENNSNYIRHYVKLANEKDKEEMESIISKGRNIAVSIYHHMKGEQHD